VCIPKELDVPIEARQPQVFIKAGMFPSCAPVAPASATPSELSSCKWQHGRPSGHSRGDLESITTMLLLSWPGCRSAARYLQAPSMPLELLLVE
jgi:hypothetical protein